MRPLQTRLPPHHLLTIGEVAQYMRVDVSTVKRWLQKRVLPCVRVGGTTRIMRKDLLALIRYSRTKKVKGAALKGRSIEG